MDLENTVTTLLKHCKEQSPAIIFLRGPLGAGKTFLTNTLAKEIGISQHLPSPTFTFLQEYSCSYEGKKRLIHADFYRIEEADAEKTLDQIGFWDYLDGNTIICIEWPEKVASIIETLPHITVTITPELTSSNRLYELS